MDNEAIHGKKGTKWKAGDDLTLQIEGHASPGCSQLFLESCHRLFCSSTGLLAQCEKIHFALYMWLASLLSSSVGVGLVVEPAAHEDVELWPL